MRVLTVRRVGHRGRAEIARSRALAAAEARDPHPLLELQRTHGNAFVQRLVAIYRRPAWADQAGWADARKHVGGKANIPPGQTGVSGVSAPTDKAGNPTPWNAFAQLVNGMWRIPIEGLNGIQVPGKADERHERLASAATQWGTVLP